MESQRFALRHGWITNRRAVVVDALGLTIERWVGAPRRIAWRQIATATWDDADHLTVRWAHGVERFGPAVRDLEGLAKALAEGMACLGPNDVSALVLTPGDLLEALDGYRLEVLDPASDAGPDGLFDVEHVLLQAVVLLVGVGAIAFQFWWLLEHGAPYDDRLLIVRLAGPPAALLALMLPVLIPVCERSHRRRTARWSVAADGDGVRVSRRSICRQFAWQEVIGLQRHGGGWQVHLRHGQTVPFPDSPRFDPVVRVLRMVIESRRGKLELDRPASDAALSMADEEPRQGASERGLSVAEHEVMR